MSLIQIAAQELAGPGTHRRKTNTPREFSATADRADNSVSLTPTVFFSWDQIECQFSLTTSRDCMAELLFIRREDPNALSSTRNRDVPLLCVGGGGHGGI
jgi:hypothetical protein